jgi:hypothetical protein
VQPIANVFSISVATYQQYYIFISLLTDITIISAIADSISIRVLRTELVLLYLPTASLFVNLPTISVLVYPLANIKCISLATWQQYQYQCSYLPTLRLLVKLLADRTTITVLMME